MSDLLLGVSMFAVGSFMLICAIRGLVRTRRGDISGAYGAVFRQSAEPFWYWLMVLFHLVGFLGGLAFMAGGGIAIGLGLGLLA